MARETNNLSRRENAKQRGAKCATRPHILLAEDDDELRALLAQSLRSSGYEVAELTDGLHLVARLASAGRGEFHAIVSDIRMPGASGLQVLEGLRECDDAPPMILITAFGDSETHDLARHLGAAAMFDKPFDIAALLAELRRVAPLPSTSCRAAKLRES